MFTLPSPAPRRLWEPLTGKDSRCRERPLTGRDSYVHTPHPGLRRPTGGGNPPSGEGADDGSPANSHTGHTRQDTGHDAEEVSGFAHKHRPVPRPRSLGHSGTLTGRCPPLSPQPGGPRVSVPAELMRSLPAGNRAAAGNPILQTWPEPAQARPGGQGSCFQLLFVVELKFTYHDVRHLNCFKGTPSAFFSYVHNRQPDVTPE